MIKEYKTIISNIENEFIEKKSKFISNLFYIDSEEKAKNKINEIRKKYYDAKHHVFAYVVLNNDTIVEKYTDDGEPAQTAGKPLLDLIKKHKLINVLIIVTRYFGGVLLGTGGLSRAYLQSGKLCIDNSKIDNYVLANGVQLTLNYDELDNIKHFCNKNNIIIDSIEYKECILINLIIESEKIDYFRKNIKNLLSRNIEILVLKNKYIEI
ncbi:MAG: YigZ family protein [Clostridia bacterium]|nr:YigZ family protein [Clostridia bacterium]